MLTYVRPIHHNAVLLLVSLPPLKVSHQLKQHAHQDNPAHRYERGQRIVSRQRSALKRTRKNEESVGDLLQLLEQAQGQKVEQGVLCGADFVAHAKAFVSFGGFGRGV